MTSRQFLIFCHHNNAAGSIFACPAVPTRKNVSGEVATPRHKVCAFPLADPCTSRLKTCGLNLHR